MVSVCVCVSGLSSGEFLAQLNAPLPRDKSPGSDTHHTRTDTHTTPTHHKTGAADSAAARNTDTHTGAAAPAAPEPNGAGAPVTARVLDAATEARLAHLEAVAAEVKGMRREVQSVLSMLKVRGHTHTHADTQCMDEHTHTMSQCVRTLARACVCES